MRIEENLKLGFKDVLIRPKPTTLKSRSDVELERQLALERSGQSWSRRADYHREYGHRRYIFYGLCAG
ncbi:hypothetical protein ACNKHS_00725 [Shigella flexneri]